MTGVNAYFIAFLRITTTLTDTNAKIRPPIFFFQPTALPGDVAGGWNLLTTFLYPALKSIGGVHFHAILTLATFAPQINLLLIRCYSPTLAFIMPHKGKQGLRSARNYAYSVVIIFSGLKGHEGHHFEDLGGTHFIDPIVPISKNLNQPFTITLTDNNSNTAFFKF